MDDYQTDPIFDASTEPAGPILPAVFAGFGAAVVGGIVWAIIVGLTNYEIGFAAWAMGGLVGFAMARSTPQRGTAIAGTAAALAIAGLIVARILIAQFVIASSGVDEVMDDPELMTQAVVIDMQFNGGFPDDILSELEALADDDTLSDALWGRMVDAANVRLQSMSDEERETTARQFTMLAVGSMTFMDRITAQLGPFDALWALLAVSTAWGMLKKPAPTADVMAEAEEFPDDEEMP